MTDLGELKWCLNLGVDYDQQRGRMTITQTIYIREMLTRYGLGTAHEAPTPMVPGHHLEKVKVPEEDWPEEDPYSNMTGSLQHMRLTVWTGHMKPLELQFGLLCNLHIWIWC